MVATNLALWVFFVFITLSIWIPVMVLSTLGIDLDEKVGPIIMGVILEMVIIISMIVFMRIGG